MATCTKNASITSAPGKWLAAVVFFCCTAGAVAQQPRPVVVELFTSEGCSSCPPAEAYVGQLSTRSDVVVLAFHVNYWDGLGWRDRFALAQSVERQNTYARNLGRASVYTPELVIDGRSDSVGADHRAVASALAEPRSGVPVTVLIRDTQVLVDVGAQNEAPASDVVLVAYLRHAVSAISRGENAGRKLEEFHIVRQVLTLGPWRGEATTFHVPVSSLPPEATDVAVLIQPFGQGPILGAAVAPVAERPE
jgi:hypothetical protein